MIYIDEKHVDEYMAVILRKYGAELDALTARDELTALVCLLETVYRHMHKNNWPDISQIPYPISPLCFPPSNGLYTPESQPNQRNGKFTPSPTKSGTLPMSQHEKD